MTAVHALRGLIVSVSFLQGFLRTAEQRCGAIGATLLLYNNVRVMYGADKQKCIERLTQIFTNKFNKQQTK